MYNTNICLHAHNIQLFPNTPPKLFRLQIRPLIPLIFPFLCTFPPCKFSIHRYLRENVVPNYAEVRAFLFLCALRNCLSRFANVNCCFLLFTTLPAVKCEDWMPQIAVNAQIEAHKRNLYLPIDQSSNLFLSAQANSLEARCYVF